MLGYPPKAEVASSNNLAGSATLDMANDVVLPCPPTQDRYFVDAVRVFDDNVIGKATLDARVHLDEGEDVALAEQCRPGAGSATNLLRHGEA